MVEKRDTPATRDRRTEQAERERRLAQALRDNLRRRKDQARAKAGEPKEGRPSDASPGPVKRGG